MKAKLVSNKINPGLKTAADFELFEVVESDSKNRYLVVNVDGVNRFVDTHTVPSGVFCAGRVNSKGLDIQPVNVQKLMITGDDQ